MSIVELDNIMPVKPPMVNRKTNPIDQIKGGLLNILVPWIVVIHLNTLIPVGTAMIMVAEVKYARVSTSIPIVNMWWAHTINPRNPMDMIA